MADTLAQTSNALESDGATEKEPGWAPSMRMIAAFAIVLVAVFSIIALFGVNAILETNDRSAKASRDYVTCSVAANNLQEASDYLTAESRMFVVTGEPKYLYAYLEEYYDTDRRGAAVETLRAVTGGNNAVDALEAALHESNQLAEAEFLAMYLVADATEMPNMPSELTGTDPTGTYADFSAEEKRQLAMSLEFGDDYQDSKTRISDNVKSCLSNLLDGLHQQEELAEAETRVQLNAMRVIAILMVVVMALVALATMLLVVKPLASFATRIKRNEVLDPSGAAELRYVADAYNTIYEENHRKTAILKRAAERDPLTGLLNRGAYDVLTSEHEENIALLLIDIDLFKNVNDDYGHEVGDAVLRKVASIIARSFRLTDFPCRIGGDEFAVIMTDMHPELKSVVSSKLDSIMKALRETNDDGLPQVTLSIGVAFSDSHPGEESLFRAADKALYSVKENNRNGYAFYGESE